MEVRTYGISISTKSKHVSVENLFSKLSGDSKVTDVGKNNERRFYVDHSDQDYYKGLVVTVKDQKTFCKLQEANNGEITIEVENLNEENDKNNRLMEFNFFILNKSNGFGLYQHYHNSCGVSVFGNYLKSFHKEIRDDLANQAIESYEKEHGSISVEQKQEIKKSYRNSLSCTLLTRPDDLEKILEDLHEIGAFDYEYTTVEAIARKGEPVSSFVKKRSEKVSFIDTAKKQELIKAIVSQVNFFGLKKGKVTGKDESGEAKSIKIIDMPEHFGIEDFDSVVKKLNHLNVKDFADHQITSELIKICKDNAYIFEAKVEEENI